MKITKTNIRRLIYHARRDYLTLNGLVVTVAFLIAASWAWGSVEVMQKNYALQQSIGDKYRQATIVELQTDNLTYEQRYFRSAEYQELAMRERTALVMPGESVLVLPSDQESPVEILSSGEQPEASTGVEPSNFKQWMDFLFGGSRLNR